MHLIDVCFRSPQYPLPRSIRRHRHRASVNQAPLFLRHISVSAFLARQPDGHIDRRIAPAISAIERRCLVSAASQPATTANVGIIGCRLIVLGTGRDRPGNLIRRYSIRHDGLANPPEQNKAHFAGLHLLVAPHQFKVTIDRDRRSAHRQPDAHE